jgi:23S rRNA pseudouridine2604 synthase
MQHDGIQINKYISSSGYCSRREADKLIEQGRVMINDKVAKVTHKVGENDSVSVDFEYIKKKKVQAVYMALNKPVGVTSTTDLKDKSNIISFLNYPKRIFPIGRLDKDSEGLILLTNDGDIVNKILRAENNHDKEYVVTVNKAITPEFIYAMSNGVSILGTQTMKCKVKQESSKKFRIILKQGLNRQIRRMCEVLGYDVIALVRVRIMNIHLDKLQPGKWRYLTPNEITDMETLLKDSSKTKLEHAKTKS